MNLLFAILIQAPAVPAPKPAPVSNIVVERFALRGEEPKFVTVQYGNRYF
jgi:hypothetical protein